MVTGSRGFIGRNVSKKFQNLVEYDVQINKTHNIFDKYAIAKFLKAEKPDVVIHLAANANPSVSIEYPPYDLETNITGTVDLLECCKDEGIEHFIYSSSAVVYGNPKSLPIREDHPINPANPYGISKYAGELYCKYYEKLGLPVTILRFFNIYGENQSKGFFIPDIIKKISSTKSQKLPMRGSPNDSRDFLYVDDLASCVKKVVEKEPTGEIINVGGGKEHKILDVANLICKIMKKKKKLYYKKPIKNSGSSFHADISHAQKILDWKPKTELKDGLKRTVSSYLE